jgi:hypothetical protein
VIAFEEKRSMGMMYGIDAARIRRSSARIMGKAVTKRKVEVDDMRVVLGVDLPICCPLDAARCDKTDAAARGDTRSVELTELSYLPLLWRA